MSAEAAEIAPGVGLLLTRENGGLVAVHGLAAFAWNGGTRRPHRSGPGPVRRPAPTGTDGDVGQGSAPSRRDGETVRYCARLNRV